MMVSILMWGDRGWWFESMGIGRRERMVSLVRGEAEVAGRERM